ncbi:MAG: cupin domain-containing protein [Sulfurimonas sp.]|jgi:quercetin dioxygenase-like cupin family protein
MIVKSNNAVKKSFLGVDFVVLSIGEKSMVTKMLYKLTDNVPKHSHPNEQSGYIVSGQYRLKFDTNDIILEVGDSYSIPANVEHSLEIITAGEIVDVFSPPRQDYL